MRRSVKAMKHKLTVSIPCKNERMNIRPCIEAARPIADEILVADSGSTDGTLDIIGQLGGCRVVEREYINSGNFKNWAIPQATHPWVLIIDADERVTPALAAEIRQVLSGELVHDGFDIFRASYFMGRRIRFSSWQSDRVLRLFRRDLGRYVGQSDHAEVSISTGKVGRLKAKFEHFTYWSYEQYLRKFQRYTIQTAQNRYAAGKRASYLQMLLTGPLRFLQCYVLRLGFLDGIAGLQISMWAGIASYAKQACLWQMEHGLPQPDPEAEFAAAQRPDLQARDAA
jgi:glycosyltransferase involved in cell wall biosynthesis